jgi:hypothetical protein
LLKEEVH